METYNRIMSAFVDDGLWGSHTFVILLGVGILFSIWSKFIQYRALTHGVEVIRGKYDDKRDPGAINHFQALSAALSGTVGLGNIGGVALAISVGGPGALFWMWITGFLGMAIKSVEVTLAMIYRDTSDPDNPHGGAMWVINKGLGGDQPGFRKNFCWFLGAVFCVTMLISSFSGGNMFQSWNVGNITNEYFGVPSVFSGAVLAVATGMVIIGGIKRIGDVCGRLVPFMCALYLLGGMAVLIVKAANVPALLLYVVQDAIRPSNAEGAFLGATAWFGLTTGLRRALFSNEAGQGSSPLAHCAAKTDEPVREGVVAGLEPFIDTCLVCTLTALVLLCTDTWNRGPNDDIQGEVNAVLSADGNWVVEGPTSVDNLPKLPAPDYWAAGNGFFLLAEVPNANADTGSKLVKIRGTLKLNERGEGMVIQWEAPPPFAKIVGKGVYRDFNGAALTGHAYDRAIPGLGKWLVTVTCWLFALSTLITWAYYGEQGIVYLFGERGVMPYKIVYCLGTVLATMPWFIKNDQQLGVLADLGTGCMLYANVPIILIMGWQAMAAFRDYFRRLDSGQMKPHGAPPIVDVVEGRDVE